MHVCVNVCSVVSVQVRVCDVCVCAWVWCMCHMLTGRRWVWCKPQRHTLCVNVHLRHEKSHPVSRRACTSLL